MLGSLWKRSPAPLVGLDISASAIKLVELAHDERGAWVVERLASAPLQTDWVVDGSIERLDEVTQTLQGLLAQSGSRAKQAALALPQASVITKKIILPGSLSEQELEVQVEAEASQYLPFPLDEVSLDFCVIGPNAKKASDVDVLLVATRKEKVQERQDVAIMAGLTPVVVDVESYACRLAASRWLGVPQHTSDAELVALLKLGSHSMHLQVVRNDETVYDSEHDVGGALLTEAIARQFSMTWEEAESQKRFGGLPAHYDAFVLQPFISNLALSVGRLMQFFFSSTSHRSIGRMAIFGGTACLPGVAEAIEQQVQAPVTVLNPFDGMQLGAAVEHAQVRRDAPMYLTACGLAMRRFLK